MVEEVLEETGFKEQRAAKMSVDDLLKYNPVLVTSAFPKSNLLNRLLSAFHDVGIHFA
jgi:18S rRNA (adenine1779-N6/adenine1780-N6)-dimethyltransferase